MSQHQHDHELVNLITVAGTRMAIEQKDGVTRAAIDGHLLYGNRDEFKQLVVTEIDRGRREFVFDLTRCGYIDSSGLGVLVSLGSKIQKAGGTVALENLNEALQELFEETKLDQLFTIRRTNA